MKNSNVPEITIRGWGKKLTPQVGIILSSKRSAFVAFSTENQKELDCRQTDGGAEKTYTLKAEGRENIQALQEALEYAAVSLKSLIAAAEEMK